MSLTPAEHLAYLRAEFAAAAAAPLSAKKARLVALLIDAFVDRLFAERRGDEDILVWRTALASRSSALSAVLGLVGGANTLVTEAVAVPLDEYPSLPLADFMVSLYNDHTVQRVRIVLPDGARLPAHDTLAEAISFLAAEPIR